MARKKEKTPLKKGAASFMLIGEAKINDYTFKIDEESQSSDWLYSMLNLGVDCGNNGTVYAELLGGYSTDPNKNNVIYVHGIKENEKGRKQDDFNNRFTIDWEDREDESILESVGDMCFITVGLEKDKKGNIFVKKFLSAYDAINYIQEHLEDGTVVNVKGNLKYSIYNDTVQVRKEITSIFLSKVNDRSNYCAKFTQTVLLDKDSIGNINKEKSIIPIYGYVVDYTKEYKGKEVKQNVPFPATFEFEVKDAELTKKFVNKFLKVRKDVTEITFEGDLFEGGTLINVTIDDVPDDIKEVIEMGIYSEEEALEKCVGNTTKEKRMVIRRPVIKLQGEKGKEVPVVQKFEGKYTEDDLILDFMTENDTDYDADFSNIEDLPFDDNDDDLSFLDEL